MIHESNFIINSKKKKVFTQSWRPESEFNAAILLIHGYAGHSNRYEYFAHKMVAYGYAVFAIDLQGFGRSEGLKADIENFDDYIEDTKLYLQQLLGKYNDIPWYLMGHCMGGNVAILTATENQDKVAGLILTAPALKIVSNLPKVVQEMANYVSAFAATVPIMAMDLSALSKDPEVIKDFENDELAYNGRIRARMAIQMGKGAEKARSVANKINIPVWLGYGAEDQWIEAETAKKFMTELSSENLRFQLFEGLYHDILHEPEKDGIISDIGKWIAEVDVKPIKQLEEIEEIIR
ncbi:MAG TPA: lysophospholipase [Balneolales bacterium]|nr:lysophospholipase [Balneolales bacterium]